MQETFQRAGQMAGFTEQTGDGCWVFRLRQGEREGTISAYPVFPGITLAYNDFHMSQFESEFVPEGEIFCIDHCREGRLEYAAREDAYSYVEAGDLKLDRRLTHKGHFELPLAHYHGAMVIFEMEKAQASLQRLAMDFPADLFHIREKFCPGRYPVVIHKAAYIEHIFGEIYRVPERIRIPYFKLKILELLLYLETIEPAKDPEEKPYFYKAQIEKAKAVQRFLAERMDENYTQEELSKRFQIPLTTLKQCFQSVYGTSIGKWLLTYRMNRAGVWLREERDVSIAEIAGRAGYDSPSKFAMAFRRVMGMAPTEYRSRQEGENFLTKRD